MQLPGTLDCAGDQCFAGHVERAFALPGQTLASGHSEQGGCLSVILTLPMLEWFAQWSQRSCAKNMGIVTVISDARPIPIAYTVFPVIVCSGLVVNNKVCVVSMKNV